MATESAFIWLAGVVSTGLPPWQLLNISVYPLVVEQPKAALNPS